MTDDELSALPGADLVRKGLADLRAGEDTIEALLVSIGAPRLRRAGIMLPEASNTVGASPDLRLYARIAGENPRDAHSRYNALIRRLVSFERALEHHVRWRGLTP